MSPVSERCDQPGSRGRVPRTGYRSWKCNGEDTKRGLGGSGAVGTAAAPFCSDLLLQRPVGEDRQWAPHKSAPIALQRKECGRGTLVSMSTSPHTCRCWWQGARLDYTHSPPRNGQHQSNPIPGRSSTPLPHHRPRSREVPSSTRRCYPRCHRSAKRRIASATSSSRLVCMGMRSCTCILILK